MPTRPSRKRGGAERTRRGGRSFREQAIEPCPPRPPPPSLLSLLGGRKPRSCAKESRSQSFTGTFRCPPPPCPPLPRPPRPSPSPPTPSAPSSAPWVPTPWPPRPTSARSRNVALPRLRAGKAAAREQAIEPRPPRRTSERSRHSTTTPAGAFSPSFSRHSTSRIQHRGGTVLRLGAPHVALRLVGVGVTRSRRCGPPAVAAGRSWGGPSFRSQLTNEGYAERSPVCSPRAALPSRSPSPSRCTAVCGRRQSWWP